MIRSSSFRGLLATLLIGFIAALLVLSPASASGKKVILFGVLNQDTPVELADGARWMMDKGDSFPVLMFKELQTKVVLQLAGTNFMTETANVRILEEHEVTPEILASYRRNVANYIDGKAKKWRDQAKAGDK